MSTSLVWWFDRTAWRLSPSKRTAGGRPCRVEVEAATGATDAGAG